MKQGAPSVTPGPTRVLVCDDECHIVRLIQVNLERQSHQVLTAFTGHEALAIAFRELPDLAVIDSTLPDMTAHELIGKLRANPETSNIRIIVMGKRDDRDDDDGPGADLYLDKPFNPMDLVRF